MKALYESGWIVLVQLRTGSYVDLVKMDQLRAEHEFVTFSAWLLPKTHIRSSSENEAPFSFQIFFYNIRHIEFLDTYMKILNVVKRNN